jgi:hypothetical protein
MCTETYVRLHVNWHLLSRILTISEEYQYNVSETPQRCNFMKIPLAVLEFLDVHRT